MTNEQIWDCIEEVDWEEIQRTMPEGMSVTTNGYKIPPKPKNEKELFWNYLCGMKDVLQIDRLNFMRE